MRKRFSVIGLGYFGQRLALELSQRGAEVVVIDNTLSKIEDMKNKVAYAVRLDSTDDTALRNQGLEDLDAVIVTIGEDFESALLTVVHLLQYQCKKVIVKSTSPVHTKIFKSVGVHSVISPEEIIAERLATTLMTANVLDSIPLTEDYRIVQIIAPERFENKTLRELDLRRKHEVNLITIKRREQSSAQTGADRVDQPESAHGQASRTRFFRGIEQIDEVETIIGVPLPETVILKDDVLVLLGRVEDVNRIVDY